MRTGFLAVLIIAAACTGADLAMPTANWASPPMSTAQTAIPSPTSLADATKSPSLAPSPTSSPLATPTATTQATSQPSPPLPRSRNPIEILNAIADFNADGELSSPNGDFQAHYSRAVLDVAGIARISIDPSVMARAHDVSLRLIYKAANRRVGSRIDLEFARGDRTFNGVVIDRIASYAVTKSEWDQIQRAFELNGIKWAQWRLNSHLVRCPGNTVCVILTPTGIHPRSTGRSLAAVPADWDRADVDVRIAGDGPTAAVWVLKDGALREWAYEYTHDGVDPLWDVFEITDYQDVDGNFSVIWQ